VAANRRHPTAAPTILVAHSPDESNHGVTGCSGGLRCHISNDFNVLWRHIGDYWAVNGAWQPGDIWAANGLPPARGFHELIERGLLIGSIGSVGSFLKPNGTKTADKVFKNSRFAGGAGPKNMSKCGLLRMKSVAIVTTVLLVSANVAVAQQHAAVDASARQISAEQLQKTLGKNSMVIDVRSPQEFARGHIPGAVNIPLDELAGKLEEMKISKNITLVTTCEHGGRSSRAAVQLQKLGYRTASFCTLDSWKKCGYKIETSDAKSRATLYKFICRHYCNADKETTDLDEICECACDQPYRECRQVN
jgi:rhodanese-related sulfurtransferase